MIIVLGASSGIGKHIVSVYKTLGEPVIGTYYSNKVNDCVFFDISKNNLTDIYQNISDKDTVIICSAISNIDECKKDEENSRNINVLGPKRIIDQCDLYGCKCIFFSTVAIFDGKKGFYTEDDIANPVTLYGNQKLEVEKYINTDEKNIVIRISRAVSCDSSENSILKEMYFKMKSDEDVLCIDGQTFSMTDPDDIALAILRLIKQDKHGVYNVASDNYISRYELAKVLGDIAFGGYNNIFLKPVDTFGFNDNRALKSGLDNEKIRNETDVEFKSTVTMIKTFLKGVEDE